MANKGFQITAVVVTPGNYDKYRKGEIGHVVKFQPDGFTPPREWYKLHNLPSPWPEPTYETPAPAEPKKRGRRPGTAKCTGRLGIRCREELPQVLDLLTNTQMFKGKSHAEIIHHIVQSQAMVLQMSNQIPKNTEVNKLIDSLSDY